MSDEPEARMWDEERGPAYESRSHSGFYEAAFDSEHMDRAPLLADDFAEPDSHCHWRRAAEPASAVPKLASALVLCAVFMVCELVGGYACGSLAVMGDAAHMLSDCGALALALLACRCGARAPDATMTYGYRRAEVLGAMASVLLVWTLTGVLAYAAACRLRAPDYDIRTGVMMLVSGAGVVFNVALAVVLNGCGGDIAHHHTHGGAACGKLANGDATAGDAAGHAAKTDRNINLRAALLHVLGDLIQSCGVLLASVLITFYPAAKIVDPLCTFVFSALVLCTSWRVARDALGTLMQAVPRGFRYRELVAALGRVAGVRHVHSAHAWALSTHCVVVSAHVAVDELSDPQAVLLACQALARDEFAVQSATFQVERYTDAMAACPACREQQPAARA